MKKINQEPKSAFILFFSFLLFLLITSCVSAKNSSDNTALKWVNNLEAAYPSRDWVAAVAQGSSRELAEAGAMQALARVFRTDIESINKASLQFSQIIDNSAESRNITFNESKNFSQDVNISANVRGLIGVQVDVYSNNDGTVYVCARMNRRECSARYSAMIRGNTAIVNRLIASASGFSEQASLDVYARLSFAHAIAQVTDNFQSILEVLDSTAANRKPSYGGANAIKTKMLETAGLITIGVSMNTEQPADRTLFTRAAGSLFRDLGFRINEQGTLVPGTLVPGNDSYVLRANVRLEAISQNVFSCRYFFNAALENRNGTAIFSFTEDDRKSHPNMASEARRLAAQAVENSFKEGKFANEFNSWLNSFVE